MLANTDRNFVSLYGWLAKWGGFLRPNKNVSLESGNSVINEPDRGQLNNWTQQLIRNLKILIESKRWAVGNKLISILSLGRYRIKKRTALDSFLDRVQNLEMLLINSSISIHSLAEISRNIESDLDALTRSIRWKTFHLDLYFLNFFIRHKSISAIQQICKLCYQIDALDKQSAYTTSFSRSIAGPVPPTLSSPGAKEKMLKLLLHQLSHNLNILVNSKRWTIGNKIISIVSLGLGKIRKQTAMQSLRYRLQEFESTPISGNIATSLIDQVQGIDGDFNALMQSLRWRALHLDIMLFGFFLPKKKSILASERIKTILKQFQEWHDLNIHKGSVQNCHHEDIESIRHGGIFDEIYYKNLYGHLIDPGMDPAEHFYVIGHKKGLKPCPNFNFAFYKKRDSG